jgi:hypothetical protein
MSNLVTVKEIVNIFVEWGFWIIVHAVAFFAIAAVLLVAFNVLYNVKKSNKMTRKYVSGHN